MDVLQIPSDAGGLKTLKAVGPKERRTLRKLQHFCDFSAFIQYYLPMKDGCVHCKTYDRVCVVGHGQEFGKREPYRRNLENALLQCYILQSHQMFARRIRAPVHETLT